MPIFSHLLLAALFLTVLLPYPSHARPAGKTALFEGVVVGLEGVPGAARLTLENPDGEQITLRINRRTNIGFSGPPPAPGEEPVPRPTGFDLLRFGHLVNAFYLRSSQVALNVSVPFDAPVVTRLRGTLLDSSPISLDTDGDGQADATPAPVFPGPLIPFLGQTRVSDSQLALLEGLPVEVLDWRALYPRLRVRAQVPDSVVHTAEVLAVDFAGRRLSLEGRGSQLDVEVAAGARITARGVAIPLAAVEPGDTVRATVTELPGRSFVLALEVLRLKVKRLTGTLQAVDPEASSVTVLTSKGSQTLTVAAEAPIWIVLWDPEPGSLSLLESRLSSHVKVEFVLRGETAVATAITATVIIGPPPAPG